MLYLSLDDRENALKTAAFYYSEEDAEQVVADREKNGTTKTQKMLVKQAFCSPQYAKSSWIAIGLIFFAQMSGSSSFRTLANPIYEAMFKDSDVTIGARTSVYCFTAATLVGSLASLVLVKYLDRKLQLWVGFLFAAVIWAVAAIAQVSGGVWLATCLTWFLGFEYAMFNYSCFFAHVAETNPDITLGIASISGAIWLLLGVLVLTPVINLVGPGLFFLISAVIAFVGFVYCLFILRSSKGLTDKECKRLYWSRRFKQLSQLEREKGEEDLVAEWSSD